jgi:pSer/pThr/pTyr-binding forkhead associated (FHA) protein
MEDFRQTLGLSGLNAQGLPPADPVAFDPPADFVPLRLLAQPGGLCIELTKPDMLIGRHSEADVRLALPDVSRRHCRFVFAEGHWQVFDLNSLNGVYVNDERLQEATLCQGDIIRIGGLTFLVDLTAAEGQAGVIKSISQALPREETERKAS